MELLVGKTYILNNGMVLTADQVVDDIDYPVKCRVFNEGEVYRHGFWTIGGRYNRNTITEFDVDREATALDKQLSPMLPTLKRMACIAQ